MRQLFRVIVNGQHKFEGHNGKQAKAVYNDFDKQARRGLNGYDGAHVLMMQDGKVIRDSKVVIHE